MDNEVVWEELRGKCYGHLSGGGVVVFSGMSAIDTALMDIKGKALGVPVYRQRFSAPSVDAFDNSKDFLFPPPEGATKFPKDDPPT